MPIDRLRADLARLREAISSTDVGDRASLERLEQLAQTVEEELEQGATLADPAGLVEELEDSVSRFEASHPNLAAIVNNILSMLGSMGV